MTNKNSATVHSDFSFKWKLGVLRSGSIVSETDFRENMLTDAGLDRYMSGSGANHILGYLAANILGTGSPIPIRRDSGLTTFTQSGTTITAGASFFEAGDTGRLFKWGGSGSGSGGVEGYLTYISATSASFSISQTVSTPTAGVVWYVNTASLVTPISGLTWSKQATGNSTTSATSGAVVTVIHTTVNVSSALASNATITEIATSNDTTNSAVLDRDLVSPSVAMLSGDQAVVTIILTCKYSPITDVAVGNVATGYNSSGNFRMVSLDLAAGGGVASFTTSGGINSGGGSVLEPNVAASVAVMLASYTPQTFSANSEQYIATNIGSNTNTVGSYSSGTFVRSSTHSYNISTGNGTIYGIGIAKSDARRLLISQALTSTFVKTGSQVLTFSLNKTIARILTN